RQFAPVHITKSSAPDFRDVYGQATAKRALEVTAAEKHNMLMICAVCSTDNHGLWQRAVNYHVLAGHRNTLHNAPHKLLPLFSLKPVDYAGNFPADRLDISGCRHI